MHDSSTSNTVAGNNIKGSNAWGIWLDCSSNIIYHNNFIDSAWGHVNSQSGTVSIWNNSCEGNYWSEYNGTDSNGDGIGDTPYIIDSNNVDHYPLMNQYWIPADVNHDPKIDILDVVKITGAYGSTPISPFWNPHADIAQPSGKIARAKRGKSHIQ
jgi:parallel beta-helix repeat protein